MSIRVVGPFRGRRLVPLSIAAELLKFPRLFEGPNRSVLQYQGRRLEIGWTLTQLRKDNDVLVFVLYRYSLPRPRRRYDSDWIFVYILWRYEELSNGVIVNKSFRGKQLSRSERLSQFRLFFS